MSATFGALIAEYLKLKNSTRCFPRIDAPRKQRESPTPAQCKLGSPSADPEPSR
jgi:hypothetical protein